MANEGQNIMLVKKKGENLIESTNWMKIGLSYSTWRQTANPTPAGGLGMVRGKQRPVAVKREEAGGDTKGGIKNGPANPRTPGNCCKSPLKMVIIKQRECRMLVPKTPTYDDHTYDERKIKEENMPTPKTKPPASPLPTSRLTGLLHSPSSAQDGVLAPTNAIIPAATPVAAPVKPKKSEDLKIAQRNRLKNNSSPAKSQIKDYFSIRRSGRQTSALLKKAEQETVEECVRTGKEEGLLQVAIDGKGRGILTTRCFKKGEFVVEYSGDLIDLVEARRREAIYAQDQNTGCYMYYFIHGNQRYCVDATKESGRLGRLVNHSRNGNTSTQPVTVDGEPHLILVAKKDIGAGEELLYDYGDRSKASLEAHPWLAT